jgi:hypothetical protein
MLRRNTCDRVKSCLAQIESTVASIVFGSRNPVDGSDSFNVVLLVAVYDTVYDVVSPNRRSGNEAWRQLDGEIWTVVILIFPSCDVADNLLDVIVAKLLNDRSGRMPL